MERLTQAILRKTDELPEGAPASAKMLLHFLAQIGGKVPKSELQKVAHQVSRFPGWVASALSRSAVNV